MAAKDPKKALTGHYWRNATVIGVIAAAGIAIGLTYNPKPNQDPLALLQTMARSNNKPAKNLTVALGYNVCVDAVLRWQDVIDATSSVSASSDFPFLGTLGQVESAFKNFFAVGAAAERTCDPKVFAQLVDKAMQSRDVRRTLGGNAGLMSRKLSNLAAGTNVILGGHVGPDAAALLPSDVKLAAPQAARDEVHLILEYGKGDTFDGAVASRANRFIITADESNQNSGAMLRTIEAADAAAADVLVVAGLHMMEPLPADRRSSSLASIAAALKARTTPFTVHIELASVASAAYMREIADTLFPVADSLGFNEQEGAFLYEALGGQFISQAGGASSTGCPIHREEVASTKPVPASVACMLRYIFQRFPSSLSRLHYHSLAYHIIAYRTQAVHKLWRANAGANAAGAVAAATEACRTAVGAMQPEQLTLIAPLDVTVADPANATDVAIGKGFNMSSFWPVVSWTWPSHIAPSSNTSDSSTGKAAQPETVTFTLAPVPVCKKPVSTVGLGDAISAAALAADAVRVVDGGSVESSLEAHWPILRYVPSVVKEKVGRIAGRVQGLVGSLTGNGNGR